jgi:hypothetical protein
MLAVGSDGWASADVPRVRSRTAAIGEKARIVVGVRGECRVSD